MVIPSLVAHKGTRELEIEAQSLLKVGIRLRFMSPRLSAGAS